MSPRPHSWARGETGNKTHHKCSSSPLTCSCPTTVMRSGYASSNYVLYFVTATLLSDILADGTWDHTRTTSGWYLGSYTDFPVGNTNWDSPKKDMAEDTLSPLPLPPLSNQMNTFTNGHSLSNCINCGWLFRQPASTTTCTLT